MREIDGSQRVDRKFRNAFTKWLSKFPGRVMKFHFNKWSFYKVYEFIVIFRKGSQFSLSSSIVGKIAKLLKIVVWKNNEFKNIIITSQTFQRLKFIDTLTESKIRKNCLSTYGKNSQKYLMV